MFPSPARNSPWARIRRSLLAVALLITAGTAGYAITEPAWSLWEAFFFCIVTITTVGYGDYGLGPTGQRFTAFLMLAGIGTLTYSASQVIQSVIHISRDQERRMRLHIESLHDHVIVSGLGRIGRAVCQQLEADDQPFVLIDPKPEAITLAQSLAWAAVRGDATDDDDLARCGLSRARVLVCLADDDPVNIVTTMTARQLRPDLLIISRAEHAPSIRKLELAGATRVISPAKLGAMHIAQAIAHNTVSGMLDFIDENGRELAIIEVNPGPAAVGRTIEHLTAAHPGIVFVALRTPDGQLNPCPAPADTIDPGLKLIIAGSPHSTAAFQAAMTDKQAA